MKSKERGLTGVSLIIGNKFLGIFDFFIGMVSATHCNKMKEVSMPLRAIYTQECKTSAK